MLYSMNTESRTPLCKKGLIFGVCFFFSTIIRLFHICRARLLFKAVETQKILICLSFSTKKRTFAPNLAFCCPKNLFVHGRGKY